MPDRFDPYYKWLGIPPGEQPPHCYRLLGVSLFEEDRDAIESAAEGRMIQLRGYQNGPRSELSQKLLREVANARLTLLDPAKRAAYDHDLRSRLAAKSPAASAPPPVSPPPAARPAPPAAPLPVATPLPAEPPAPIVSGNSPRLGGRRAKKRRRLIPAALAGIAVVVVVGGIIAMNRGDGEPLISSRPIDGGPPGAPPPAVDDTPAPKVAANATDASVDSDIAAAETDVDEEPTVPATEASASDSDESSDVRPTETVQAAAAVSPAPDATNASQPEVSSPPNPGTLGASEAVARKPPPSAEEQQAAMAVVEEVYKLSQERTPVEQLQLVEELLKLARQSQGAADQFALFTAAGILAGEAGDARRVWLARQELERRFTVDLTEATLDDLSKIARSTREEGVIDSLVAAAPMALAPAIEQDKWDQAAAFLDALYSACQKPAGRRYAKAVGDDRTEITRLRRTWQSVQEAQATLETNADDADARLAVGRWQCFIHDDWDAGLPHLAAGSEEPLKSLAEQDLTAGDDSARQMQIADAWYEAAGSAADEAKLGMQRRARHWYEKARPTVTVRLVQLKVERRLEELAKVPSPNLVPDHEGRLPMGRWVHVLGLVNPEEHVVAGGWARFRETVGVVQPADAARFLVPLTINGSYEFEFEFTAVDGKNVSATLPVGEGTIDLQIGHWGGKIGGLGLIDGKQTLDNITKIPMDGLPTNQRLHAAVRIELEEDRARITVHLQGTPFTQWEGPQSALLARPGLPNPRCPGFISGWKCRTVFHTARLRMLSGEGQLLPAVASTWAAESSSPDSAGPWTFNFADRARAEQYWEWNDEWTFAEDGARAPKGPQSFLRTRHVYGGDVSLNFDFSLGQATFSNTGGCWITVWGQKLNISNAWRRLDAKIQIRREGDEIIFVHNGNEERRAVEPEFADKPTPVEIRWRSRTAHFRSIEIQAESIAPRSD